MASDTTSGIERRDFRYSRRRLAKFVAGSSGFTAIGVFLIYWSAATVIDLIAATVTYWTAASWDATLSRIVGVVLAMPAAAVGLGTVTFFGMVLIVATGAFFNRAPVVTITAQSIHDRRWGGPPVPWSEVREIAGIFIDSMNNLIPAVPVAIVVDDPSRYYRPRGIFARFAYGTMRNPLFFNMVALDGTDMDLITDLVVRVPDKIRREKSMDC